MTPEQILDIKDISEIEKLTSEELLKYFEPYLDLTRPQLVVGKETKAKGKINLEDAPDLGTKKRGPKLSKLEAFQLQMNAFLKSQGVDPSQLESADEKL